MIYARHLIHVTALGLSLCAHPALGQQLSPADVYPVEMEVPFTLEEARRVIGGEFNDDAVLDFALLQGQTVTIAFNPGYVECTATLIGLYRDIERYSRTGHAEGADLLLVSTDGLERGRWNNSSNQFDKSPAIDAALYPGLASSWEGATMLRVGELNGDIQPDLVGVGSDLRTILIAIGSGDDLVPATGTVTVTARGDVLDLMIFDNDGDGPGELLVVSTWGLEVFDTDMTELFSFEEAAPWGHVERIRDAGVQADRMAWLRPRPDGTRRLSILDGQPFATSQVLDVTNLGASNLTAGFFDDNASADLALTDSNGAAVRILKQRTGGAYSLQASDVRTVVIEGLAAMDLETPTAFGDIDGDGDQDIIAARSLHHAIVIGRNDTFDHRSIAPRFVAASPTTALPQIWETGPSGNTEINMRFEAPHDPLDPNPPSGTTHAHPEGATHLEVKAWLSTNANGDFTTDSEPIGGVSIPLGEATTALYDGVRYHQAAIPYFGPGDATFDVMWVTTRYIHVASDGSLANCWAHNSLFFAVEQNDDGVEYVEDLPFTWGSYRVFEHDPWDLPENWRSNTSDEKHHTVGSTNCIPDVVPDDPPSSQPPAENTVPPTPPAAGN
ncbi:MAG: hypothetical protein AAGG01_08785 [Planctomycetota bacterium]